MSSTIHDFLRRNGFEQQYPRDGSYWIKDVECNDQTYVYRIFVGRAVIIMHFVSNNNTDEGMEINQVQGSLDAFRDVSKSFNKMVKKYFRTICNG